MTRPATKAGQDMLANHGFRRPVTAAWIMEIEDQARRLTVEQIRARLEKAADRLDARFGVDAGDVLRDEWRVAFDEVAGLDASESPPLPIAEQGPCTTECCDLQEVRHIHPASESGHCCPPHTQEDCRDGCDGMCECC